MSDADRLSAYGDWLHANQDKRGSDQWNTVASAFQQLDSAQNAQVENENRYAGVSGKLKAIGQGAVSGLGKGVDALNSINPLYPLMRYGAAKIAGGDVMGDPHASDALKNTMGVDEANLPENARAVFRGGEAFGNAASMALPFNIGARALAAVPEVAATAQGAGAALARGLQPAAKAVQPIANWMEANPGVYASGELAAATGAGGGTAAADMVFPNNEYAHMAGGMLGSVMGPGVLARAVGTGVSKLPGAGRVGGKVTDMFDANAGAARAVNNAFEEYGTAMGQNPMDMMRAAHADVTSPTGVGPATTRTADPVLHDMAAYIGRRDPLTGRALSTAHEDALGALRDEITGQIGGGDAQRLINAAKQRAAGVVQNTSDIAGRTRTAAQDAGSKLRVSPLDEEQSGQNLTEMIRDALLRNKRGLDTLEGAIPDSTPLGQQVAQQYRSSMNATVAQKPSSALSVDTTTLLDNLSANRAATLGDYRELASQLRADARMYRSNPEKQAAAAHATDMANRLDQTFNYRLARYPGAYQSVDAYNTATGQMYDRFNRSAAGDLLGASRSGGTKVMPEVSAQKVLTGSDLGQSQRIDAALGMTDTPFARTALETQQRAQVGKAVLDPQTGIAKPGRVAGQLQNEPGVYEQFPGLTSDMKTAGNLGGAAEGTARQAAAVRKGLASGDGATGAIIRNSENPTSIVEGALKAPNPVQKLEELHRSVSRLGGTAKDDFKRVVNEYVRAPGQPALVSADRFTQPVNQQGQTLGKWMKARGYMSRNEFDVAADQALKIARSEHARALANPSAVDPEGRVPDVAKLAARIVGSIAGGKASGLLGGRTLIAQAASAKAAEKALTKMGGPRQLQVLENAMRRPEELAPLLQRAIDLRAAHEAPPVVTPTGKPMRAIQWPYAPATQTSVLWPKEQRKRPPGLLN